ncbi:MAG TPA: amidohydrolase family protein [Gemmatimonadaceae bacterium]|nr:amidohydrolase family protein [Gemmatimonadaceae bacterium]
MGRTPFMQVGASIVAVMLASACTNAPAQSGIDPALARYINGIHAIDDHAHPMRPVTQGAPADTDFDALPLDGIPPFDLPSRLKADDPVWRQAQNALYHIPLTMSGPTYHSTLKNDVAAAQRTNGLRFPEWALDQANIDVMIANRISVGPGLMPPRFRWLAFADPLMLPLDVSGEATLTPDTKPLYPREAKLLQRYMREINVSTLPATLADYVRTVVAPTLARERANGAIGIKFEAAYLRPLNFDDPDSVAAAKVYAKYARGGTPTHAEYKTVEDYLFRAIAREAGAQKMPVQIHVLETFGGFYATHGSAPHLLEPAFNDSTLRGTKFVIVHGGWPLVGETQALLSKPNVYADFSMMDDILSSAVLAGVLRQWLGEWPDKVLFGTDAFDGGAEQGWEQIVWVASTTARRALAISLSGMMRDGDVTRDRAEAIARMVMHDNAAAVYGLKESGSRPIP